MCNGVNLSVMTLEILTALRADLNLQGFKIYYEVKVMTDKFRKLVKSKTI